MRGLLDDKPYLRASLALCAEPVESAGGGPVLDGGCGTGYATDQLHRLGVDGSVAGVVAFWSLVHVPDHAVPGATTM